MPDERLRATVRGRVQGVGFRYVVMSEARSPDGSVRVEAEGPPERLDRLEDFLRGAPSPARVDEVASERLEASGEFDRFYWR
jgi:acylphosphatase